MIPNKHRFLLLASIACTLVVLVTPIQTTGSDGEETKKPNPENVARVDRYGDALPPGAKGATRVRTDFDGDPLPPGVLMRLGTTRWRHGSGAVLAFTSKNTLVSIGRDHNFRVWDTASGGPARALPGPFWGELPGSFACTADGAKLAIFQGKPSRISIWNLKSGKEVQAFPWKGETDGVIAFSGDGETLVAAHDRQLRVFDVATGRENPSSFSHNSRIRHAAVSPDGKVIGSSDRSNIFLWDAQTGTLLRQIVSESDVLAFSIDGRTLAAVYRTKGVACWSTANGEELARFPLPTPDPLYIRPCLAFSRDGQLLAAGGDGRPLLVWHFATRKLVQQLPLGRATALAFAADGKTLATSAFSGVHIWDLGTGKETFPPAGHTGEVNQVTYSHDGELLASGSWEDGTVRLWDTKTGHERRALGSQTTNVWAVAFGHDDRTVVSAGAGDGRLQLSETATGKNLRTFSVNGPNDEQRHGVYGARLSGNGKLLAAVTLPREGGRRALCVWDVVSGRQVVRHELTGSPFPFCLSPNSNLLAYLPNGEVTLIDLSDGRKRTLNQSGPGIGTLAFSADGKLLAVGRVGPKKYWAESVVIWDLEHDQVVATVETGEVGFFALSPDTRYLATASMDRFCLWEVSTGKAVLHHDRPAAFWGMHGPAFASSLAYAPDGRSVATGLLDSTVLLWDLSAEREAGSANEIDSSPKELNRSWEVLAGDDARRAYAVIQAWGGVSGAYAISFLREKLRPAKGIDPGQLQQLLRDLESEEFAKRESARRELEKIADEIRPALRSALAGDASLELRRRLENILSRPLAIPKAELRRELRAVEILERQASPEARDLLAVLGRGAPDARLTRESRAALERLARGVPTP